MTYGYIRVSTDKQTLENQRYEILRFCQAHGLAIDGWIEETISGTTAYTKRALGRPRGSTIPYQRLHLYPHRERIARLLAQGCSQSLIARKLRVSRSTLSRFLSRSAPPNAKDERCQRRDDR